MIDVVDKNICMTCVGDEFVTQWIAEDGVIRICDYCDDSAECVKMRELCEWVDDVYRKNYQPGGEYPVFHDGQDKPSWEIAGSYPGDIIGDNLLAEEDVVNDVLSELSEKESYAVARDGETAYYDEGYCYEEIPMHDFHHSELWDSFCDHVKHRSRFFGTKAIELLIELFSGISELQFSSKLAPIRTLDLESDERFIYRARGARTDYSRIIISIYPEKELGSPPKHSAVAGRMNPAGIPVFYGALDRKTCLTELRLPVGDIALSGKFEIISPMRVMDLSVFREVYQELSIFDPDYQSKVSRLKFLRRFEDEVSRPIIPGDELLEYIPTQALVEYLASHFEPKIDGLIYSSTQTNGAGRNIVIFNHAAHIKQVIHNDGDNKGSRRFEVMWSPSHSNYSIYETEDDEKGIQIEKLQVSEEIIEPTLQLVDGSLKIHLITGLSHEYGSDTVNLSYKEDLENLVI